MSSRKSLLCGVFVLLLLITSRSFPEFWLWFPAGKAPPAVTKFCRVVSEGDAGVVVGEASVGAEFWLLLLKKPRNKQSNVELLQL